MNNIRKYPMPRFESIHQFVDAYHETNLNYTCGDLFQAGLESQKELLNGLQHAIQTLKGAGIHTEHHIKHIFLTDIKTGEITHEWKLSKLGLILTAINTKSYNSNFNKFKIDLLNQSM